MKKALQGKQKLGSLSEGREMTFALGYQEVQNIKGFEKSAF